MTWPELFAAYVPTQQAPPLDVGIAPIPSPELDEAAEQFLAANPECPLSRDELLKLYLTYGR